MLKTLDKYCKILERLENMKYWQIWKYSKDIEKIENMKNVEKYWKNNLETCWKYWKIKWYWNYGRILENIKNIWDIEKCWKYGKYYKILRTYKIWKHQKNIKKHGKYELLYIIIYNNIIIHNSI